MRGFTIRCSIYPINYTFSRFFFILFLYIILNLREKYILYNLSYLIATEIPVGKRDSSFDLYTLLYTHFSRHTFLSYIFLYIIFLLHRHNYTYYTPIILYTNTTLHTPTLHYTTLHYTTLLYGQRNLRFP